MMSRVGLWALLAGVCLLSLASPVLAAEGEAEEGAVAKESSGGFSVLGDKGAALLGAAIGAGLVIMGGAAGISRIGGNAVEAMARQPEAAGSINGAALILAAMIEGATLFAVVVCLLGVIFGRAI